MKLCCLSMGSLLSFAFILATQLLCIIGMTYTDRISTQKLLLGDRIESESADSTYLEMRSDGDLVLINDGNIIWSTDTKGARYANLQADGNLCVYESFYYQKARWCSQSNGHQQPQLVVQNACAFIENGDGKRIWHTKTAGCRWPKVPCIKGENNKPVGCKERIFLCSKIDEMYKNVDIDVRNRIDPDDNTRCHKEKSGNRLKSTVDEKEGKGNEYIVKFDDKDGNCYGIKMYGGECWGIHPTTDSNYDCMGRCGAGCGSWTCSNWGRDCMKHDVCGWYLSSTTGFRDKNCKDEFWDAYNDRERCCHRWCLGGSKCRGPRST